MTLAFALLLACGQTASPPATPPATPPAPPADARPAAPPAAAPFAEQIHVIDPWVRAMPPGSPNSAAFLTLHNAGDKPTAVVAGLSDVSTTVELHTHAEVDGKMQMRQVPRFPLAPDQALELKPGGDHLMLIGLQGELALGQVVNLVIRLDDGSELKVEAPVREGPPSGGGAGGHGEHAGH